ncbi:COP9 signalosome (CSN) subunit [Rhizina undulata]
MALLYKTFRKAIVSRNGELLASVFNPENPDANDFAFSTNHQHIRREVEYELTGISALRSDFTNKGFTAWGEVFAAHWKTVYALERDDASWKKAYEAQKETTLAVIRGYSNGNWPNWTLPLLYIVCRYLRTIAIRSDDEAKRAGNKPEHLEDAARHINRTFTLCISDRAPLDESRKWGTYYIVNLLFKTYFKLNAITLSKNILRALQATNADMPALESFPKSHIVTFKYYVGVICFLEEDYPKAESYLSDALKLCKKDAVRNQELILTYLIPAHLLTTHTIPTVSLLSRYPRLEALFGPICKTIKSGNLRAFDAALEANEAEFVKKRIYLTLERGRDIAMRNLFRKVFLIGEKKTRIPVKEFQAAMACAGQVGDGQEEDNVAMVVEAEEVECLLANLIYKGLMKGYISREKQMVVLSAREAFPGTSV